MSAERKVPYILVVDDEEVIRELLRRRLSVEGYEVETAEDGEEAVAMLNRDQFVNLVVTDVKMPGLDGMEVLKRTKAKSEDTEVIIMTAYASTETAIEAVRRGAYDYLQKPFEHIDDVALKVKRALKQQALVLQNREVQRKLDEMNKGLKQVVISRTKELNEVQDAPRNSNRVMRQAIKTRGAAIAEIAARLRRSVDEVARLAKGLQTAGNPVGAAIANEASACSDLCSKLGEHIPVPAGVEEKDEEQ